MGEFLWTCKVIDERTNEKFRLKSDGETIRVYPLDEDFSLGTWMRFYEFVVKNIDPMAEPVTSVDNRKHT